MNIRAKAKAEYEASEKMLSAAKQEAMERQWFVNNAYLMKTFGVGLNDFEEEGIVVHVVRFGAQGKRGLRVRGACPICDAKCWSTLVHTWEQLGKQLDTFTPNNSHSCPIPYRWKRWGE